MSAEEIHEELRNSGKLPVAMRMVSYLAARNELFTKKILELLSFEESAKLLNDWEEIDRIFDADNLKEEYENWKKASDWFKDYSISEVIRALESEGVEVVKDSDGNYDIRFFSHEGEDLSWTINKPKSAEDFARQVEEIAEDFDDEEHIKQWLEAKDNGVQGIPSIKALVHDAEWIQEKLNTLAEIAEKAAGMKRVSIKEILARAERKKKQE